MTEIDDDSSLNLRKTPDLGGEILMRLYKGQQVLVLERCPQEGWVKVRTDVAEGYVVEEYLTAETRPCGAGFPGVPGKMPRLSMAFLRNLSYTDIGHSTGKRNAPEEESACGALLPPMPMKGLPPCRAQGAAVVDAPCGFFRGYLMMVGALTTLYVLLQLAVRLLVEIGKWMP